MYNKIRNCVRKWQMLKKEDCVIVGISGGADSVCLLLVLLELKKEIGFDIVAVHVNHMLRGEDANADETFVKDFCSERGVPCVVYAADVDAIAKERRQSTEETGRDVRRMFYQQALQEYKGTKIALAHHQNDNAETFLFRLARGTGIKGLGSIAPVKDNVIRPLLCVNRDEIEAYLKERGVSYCVDATNLENEYARNRIRNDIIPYMESELNAQTVAHINETIEQFQQLQAYLDEQTEYYLKQCVTQSATGYEISLEQYQIVPEVLKSMVIKQTLVRLSGMEKDIEAVHIEKVQELFSKQVGRKVDLPYQMEARREYGGVELTIKKHVQSVDEVVVFNLDDQVAEFSIGNHIVRCRILSENEKAECLPCTTNTKQFDCSRIEHEVCVRTRRQGDYITIHPDGRTQKLKNFFVNEKVPQRERDKVLVVADGSHVMWIVGYRVNCLYESKSKAGDVLEITINKNSNV